MGSKTTNHEKLMNNKRYITIIGMFLLLLMNTNLFSQSKGPEGVWKGTSLCQVKNSPCHDEIAVYHVARTDTANLYRVTMNKVVNNEEENMGTLDFTLDASGKVLNATSNSRRGKGYWQFKVNGDNIDGTLYVENNILYRIIKLKRQ